MPIKKLLIKKEFDTVLNVTRRKTNTSKNVLLTINKDTELVIENFERPAAALPIGKQTNEQPVARKSPKTMSFIRIGRTHFEVAAPPPPAPAPTFISATIQPSGNTINFLLSDNTSIGSGDSAGFAFSLSGGAASVIYTSGTGTSTLSYSLSRTVFSGETGTYAYTQPGNGLEGTMGGTDVATIFPTILVNNSAQTQPAPTIISATVSTNGASIALVFSTVVVFGLGGSTGFILSLSGGASVMSSPVGEGTNTLIYTLSRTINNGETGTIAYTQPGNGVEALSSGVDLITLSNFTVTNNSTAGGVTWSSTVPTINFAQGSASVQSLVPYTSNFNASLHQFVLTSGSLPAGITIDPTSGYVYNGTSPIATTTGNVVTIIDNAEADWIARSTAAGVTYANDMRDPARVTPFFFANGSDPVTLANISHDTTDGVTGGACVRIITPAAYAGDNSAVFRHPLNTAWTNNSQHFGSTPFWIQWRMKINAGRLVPSNPGLGWKFFNLAHYNFLSPVDSPSNTLAEIVGQDTEHRGHPQAYHRNTVGSFPPFDEALPPFDFKQQNMIDNGVGLPNNQRFCLYSDDPAYTGCLKWPVDEWFTMMVRVKFGTYGGTANNEFSMWLARAGASAWTQTHHFTNFDLGPANGAYGGSNGLHWHIYETNRINSPQDAIVKFDQIIVSTQAVALPLV